MSTKIAMPFIAKYGFSYTSKASIKVIQPISFLSALNSKSSTLLIRPLTSFVYSFTAPIKSKHLVPSNFNKIIQSFHASFLYRVFLISETNAWILYNRIRHQYQNFSIHQLQSKFKLLFGHETIYYREPFAVSISFSQVLLFLLFSMSGRGNTRGQFARQPSRGGLGSQGSGYRGGGGRGNGGRGGGNAPRRGGNGILRGGGRNRRGRFISKYNWTNMRNFQGTFLH